MITKAQFLAAFEKYSPNQARDDHGRWTDMGGGGASMNAQRSKDVRADLARLFGESELWRKAARAKGGTAMENARKALDRALAKKASAITRKRLTQLSNRNRRAIADKIVPSMNSTERRRLAKTLGAKNEFEAVRAAVVEAKPQRAKKPAGSGWVMPVPWWVVLAGW